MIEIGAGGGSIARVEPSSGLMKVGPRSAGAKPGPVCYGLGGTEPTVTDADLVLGRLNPDYFLGGEMHLELDGVRRAFTDGVARKLKIPAMESALGVQRIVDETMAAATRMHLAEKGRDPRRYTLIAFGGAGPVHAWNLARLLKMKRMLVPLGRESRLRSASWSRRPRPTWCAAMWRASSGWTSITSMHCSPR